MISALANINFISIFIGICILAAAIVITIFTTKSTPKKGITQKQPVENIEAKATPKKRHAPQRSSAPPDQRPIDEGLDINERLSTPLPGVTSPELEINAALLPLDQGIPNVEPIKKDKSEVNIPQEEPEPIEREPEELNEASDDGYREQPTTEDAVLNLFTAEMAEESNISKFAANLNNIDVHDLPEEARKLINQLKGGKG